jgi:hypothetical protein
MLLVIATVVTGLAITYYYFNLIGPTQTPTPRLTPQTVTILTVISPISPSTVKATSIGPLRIDVFDLAETTHINFYSGSSSSCAKSASGMKIIVIFIRLKNVGSRAITSDEIPQYFDDLVLITNVGRDYRYPAVYKSPYWVSAPQDECVRSNAITILWPPPTYYVLKPGEYYEAPHSSLFYKTRLL